MTVSLQLDADLLIAGGSTAGLATAIYARLAGLSCIIVEPQAGVIDKPCGEGLMPAVLPLLHEMGIELEVTQSIEGIRYLQHGREVTCRFPTGTGLGVRRTTLQSSMTERAKALGVEFIQGKVKDFADHGTQVEAFGKKIRYLVGCDGLRSKFRANLGISTKRTRPPRFGLRQHFYVAHAPPFVEVYWRNDFELYVTPVDNHTVNVAVLFEKGRPFDEFLAEVPELKSILGKSQSPVRGAGPFEQARSTPKKGNVFLVGDAAGFLDPITGEGNQLAIGAARALISSIASGRPETYPALFMSLSRDYWVVTSLLLTISRRPWTRNLIVPLLRHSPWLFSFALARLSKAGKLKPLPFAPSKTLGQNLSNNYYPRRLSCRIPV